MNDFGTPNAPRLAMPTSRQELQALHGRWELLKQQLGPSAPQNDEYVQLSRILGEVMRHQQAQAQAQAQAGHHQLPHQTQAQAQAQQQSQNKPLGMQSHKAGGPGPGGQGQGQGQVPGQGPGTPMMGNLSRGSNPGTPVGNPMAGNMAAFGPGPKGGRGINKPGPNHGPPGPNQGPGLANGAGIPSGSIPGPHPNAHMQQGPYRQQFPGGMAPNMPQGVRQGPQGPQGPQGQMHQQGQPQPQPQPGQRPNAHGQFMPQAGMNAQSQFNQSQPQQRARGGAGPQFAPNQGMPGPGFPNSASPPPGMNFARPPSQAGPPGGQFSQQQQKRPDSRGVSNMPGAGGPGGPHLGPGPGQGQPPMPVDNQEFSWLNMDAIDGNAGSEAFGDFALDQFLSVDDSEPSKPDQNHGASHSPHDVKDQDQPQPRVGHASRPSFTSQLNGQQAMFGGGNNGPGPRGPFPQGSPPTQHNMPQNRLPPGAQQDQLANSPSQSLMPDLFDPLSAYTQPLEMGGQSFMDLPGMPNDGRIPPHQQQLIPGQLPGQGARHQFRQGGPVSGPVPVPGPGPGGMGPQQGAPNAAMNQGSLMMPSPAMSHTNLHRLPNGNQSPDSGVGNDSQDFDLNTVADPTSNGYLTDEENNAFRRQVAAFRALQKAPHVPKSLQTALNKASREISPHAMASPADAPARAAQKPQRPAAMQHPGPENGPQHLHGQPQPPQPQQPQHQQPQQQQQHHQVQGQNQSQMLHQQQLHQQQQQQQHQQQQRPPSRMHPSQEPQGQWSMPVPERSASAAAQRNERAVGGPGSKGAELQNRLQPAPRGDDQGLFGEPDDGERLKMQQWQAQQQQEEMFAKRYIGKGPEYSPFVVGGSDLVDVNRDLSDLRRSDSESPLGTHGSDSKGPDTSSVPDVPRSTEMLDRFGFSKHVDPYSLFQDPIAFGSFCHRDEMLSIPSLLPLGVSAQGMKRVRNLAIWAEINRRREELEQKSSRTIDEEIELKQLRLVKWQRAVRGDLLTAMHYFNSTSIDRSNRVHFARLKRLSSSEAAVVEQFYNQQSLAKLQKDKEKNKSGSAELENQLAAVTRFHNRKTSSRDKLKKSIVEYHSYAEREERKKLERTAKQRLRALRANDEEAYIKLLDQIKDTRITHLLKQTNLFLDSLAQAVRTQQQDTIKQLRAEGTEVEEIVEEVPVEGEDADIAREKIDYYEVAHRVKEEVTEQPSILVGGTLKEYQVRGLQWMVSLYNNNLNGILADEMGLGKTIQSIALVTHLIEKKGVKGPFLILVPLSTMTNWSIEFETWAPSLKKIDYKGAPSVRKAKQALIRQGDFQVLLTTYEYVIKDRPILSRIKWAHMIIDEGHRMKNAQSKLSSTLTQHYNTRHRLILTGTPLQNNLPELWALLNFVLPKIFNSVKSFDEWFNKPFANAGSNDKIDLSEEETLLIIRRLHKVLRPFLLRRLKKDVEKDLPEKSEKVIKCRMSALQCTLYQQLLRYNALFFGDPSQKSGVKGLNNRIIQLRKICNHPFVFEEIENVVNPTKQTNDLLWRVSGKFELLDRILPKFKATGHRVLLFFQMTQIMDIMEDFLRLKGLKYLRLDGSTKAEERTDLLKAFNAPDSPYFCFLLSTRAGGLGLNLQTADTVIIYDTDWNPHQDLQAQDRAHRIGQTKEVRILRLITDESIEENILERAQGKLKIDGKVIQAGKFDNKSTAEEQEAFLRSLLEAEETDGLEVKEEDPENLDDDELNSMLARNEDEREVFAQIDRARLAQVEAGEPPRLFTEAELPEVCTNAYLSKHMPDESSANAGQEGFDDLRPRSRARKAFRGSYVDERALEENYSRKRAKLSRRGRRSELRSESPSSGDDEFGRTPESPAPGLRAARSIPPVQSSRRQGRPPKVRETLSPEARDKLTEDMVDITKQIKATKAEDGRRRIDLFLEFPSRKLYPDYYKIIQHPVAVAYVEKRIQTNVYQALEQFAYDWRLMFANARRYNKEGSFVYQDADELENVFVRAYIDLTGEEPPMDPRAPPTAKQVLEGAQAHAQARAERLSNTATNAHISPSVSAPAPVPAQVPAQSQAPVQAQAQTPGGVLYNGHPPNRGASVPESTLSENPMDQHDFGPNMSQMAPGLLGSTGNGNGGAQMSSNRSGISVGHSQPGAHGPGAITSSPHSESHDFPDFEFKANEQTASPRVREHPDSAPSGPGSYQQDDDRSAHREPREPDDQANGQKHDQGHGHGEDMLGEIEDVLGLDGSNDMKMGDLQSFGVEGYLQGGNGNDLDEFGSFE